MQMRRFFLPLAGGNDSFNIAVVFFESGIDMEPMRRERKRSQFRLSSEI